MGYPRHYVGRYPALAQWLLTQGHRVYPMEMFCQPVAVKMGPIIKMDYVKHPYEYQETHYLYGNVDVVSMRQDKLYGWEYKSKGDDVTRAINQLANYARSFNYVCLAVQDLTPLDRLIRKKGLYLKTIFQNMGAGIYFENGAVFDELYAPKEQTPIQRLNEDLINRFRRYTTGKPTPTQDRRQLLLTGFHDK